MYTHNAQAQPSSPVVSKVPHNMVVPLSEAVCWIDAHDTKAADLPLTALLVVDYSSGGPAFPDHERVWSGNMPT